jgi:hypothetical protein
LEARLRRSATPIISRVEHGVVLLDLRTLLPGDPEIIMDALAAMLTSIG